MAAIVIHWVIERFYVELGHRYPPTIYGSRRNPPSIRALSPQLQTNPARDMADRRQRDREMLNSYGWIDKKSGTIRIPIERAWELNLQRARQAEGAKP